MYMHNCQSLFQCQSQVICTWMISYGFSCSCLHSSSYFLQLLWLAETWVSEYFPLAHSRSSSKRVCFIQSRVYSSILIAEGVKLRAGVTPAWVSENAVKATLNTTWANRGLSAEEAGVGCCTKSGCCQPLMGVQQTPWYSQGYVWKITKEIGKKNNCRGYLECLQRGLYSCNVCDYLLLVVGTTGPAEKWSATGQRVVNIYAGIHLQHHLQWSKQRETETKSVRRKSGIDILTVVQFQLFL